MAFNCVAIASAFPWLIRIWLSVVAGDRNASIVKANWWARSFSKSLRATYCVLSSFSSLAVNGSTVPVFIIVMGFWVGGVFESR